MFILAVQKINFSQIKSNHRPSNSTRTLCIQETLYSTGLHLIHLTNHYSINANNNEATAAVFLEDEKAFDNVWHDDLLRKPLLIATTISIIKIIQFFLTDRYYRVKTKNAISNSRPILAGVPQGSCHCPIRFQIYINDIVKTPRASLVLFADDNMFTAHDRNPRRANTRIQNRINALHQPDSPIRD